MALRGRNEFLIICFVRVQILHILLRGTIGNPALQDGLNVYHITCTLSFFVGKDRLYHVHDVQLVLFPHSVDDGVQLVEDTLPMELVLFEGAFEALAVLEILHALAVEHTVCPVAFVFSFVALSVENAVT